MDLPSYSFLTFVLLHIVSISELTISFIFSIVSVFLFQYILLMFIIFPLNFLSFFSGFYALPTLFSLVCFDSFYIDLVFLFYHSYYRFLLHQFPDGIISFSVPFPFQFLSFLALWYLPHDFSQPIFLLTLLCYLRYHFFPIIYFGGKPSEGRINPFWSAGSDNHCHYPLSYG